MLFKNKTIQKVISSTLIVMILVPSVFFSKPKKAEAWIPDLLNAALKGIGNIFQSNTSVQTTTQTAISLKNVAKEIGRQALMAIARKALQSITKSTVNWINSGFHGNPLYIENSDSFFRDIARSEVKNFVDLIGYDALRLPFGKTAALNAIDAYKRQAKDNLEYTLSSVINDPILLRNYRNDFSVGGWNGFLINTQYPQNNYVGFQMLATEELSRRVAGTSQNAAEKVKDTVQQGLGFLSPKSCPSKPEYNNGLNEFQRPKWTESKEYKNFMSSNPEPTPAQANITIPLAEWKVLRANWEANFEKAKATWETNNTCPGGLVNTTPGSVVANQINNAMGSQFRQTELAAAMGNSLSAIFDALLNKFINDGLNKLSTKINPRKELEDNWDYYGNTLGVSPYNSTSWDAGPDEEINVAKFKQAVKDGIKFTAEELKLLDNESASTPGITQMLGQIWPKIRELDICVPGPDLGWEGRLISEAERNSQKLYEKANDSDGQKAADAQLIINSLQFATGYFKDWIQTRELLSLPSAVIYLDSVASIEDLYQKSSELTRNKREKNQTLARLKAIDASLNRFTSQPAPESTQETDLIKVKKQYDATKDYISSAATVEIARNQLSILKDQLLDLRKSVTECNLERKAVGWSTPGGPGSRFNPPTTPVVNTNFTPTTPINVITPTGIEYEGYLGRIYNNGWWPSLSPNGRYVAFGNWGDSYVLDLESGNTTPQWNFKNPPELPEGSRCAAGQWLSNTKMTFMCEIGGVDNGGRDGFLRYEVTVGEWIAKKTNDDPQLAAGNIWKAKDGHWASFLTRGFRIAKDNQVVATNVGGAMSISKNKMVYACTNEGQEICVQDGTTLAQTYPAQTPIQQMEITNDYIMYGGYGPVRGIDPNGNDIDLTLSPSVVEFVGDLIPVGNTMWVITNMSINEKNYTLLRPWGADTAIIVETPAVNADVVYKNGNFIIAYNDDIGNMKVITVPADSPRQDLGGNAGNSGPAFTTPGSEMELFCSRPIVGGYPHGAFRTPNGSGRGGLFGTIFGLASGGIAGGVVGGVVGNIAGGILGGGYNNPYKDLPLVNAADVLKWRSTAGTILTLGLGGRRHIDIELNCNIIFKTNTIDYKKDLPGTTVISNNFVDVDANAGSVCDTCAEKGQSDKYLEEVKSAARQALEELELTNPGIGDLPSYDASSGGSDEGEAAVAMLRDATMDILRNRGFTVYTSGSSPYPQVVSILKSGDTDRTDYRIVAGGEIIRDAIEAAYCGGHSTMSGEDIVSNMCLDPGGTGGGGSDTNPPTDAATKHGNHTAEIAQAKSALAAAGRTWVVPSENDPESVKAAYECSRFEITNAAAKLIPGAGILSKPGGTNCVGYSVDLITFSDGYIYDVLGGGGSDGASPEWSAKGCVADSGNGTCPDRYRQPIQYP